MSKRGRPTNWEVTQSFKKYKDANFKEERAECKFCGFKRAWQSTELQRHLNNCIPFLSQQNTLEVAQKRQRQMTLIVPTIGSSMQNMLKLHFAKAVIMDGLPLDAFEQKKQLGQVIKLINDKLQLPTAREIRKDLLPGKYSF
jgi:hypothetical protein